MLCSYLNLAPVLQNLSVGCDSHFKSKHVGIFNKCIIKLNSLFIFPILIIILIIMDRSECMMTPHMFENSVITKVGNVDMLIA